MYYILITTDSYNIFGTKVSAYEVCKSRLKNNYWPLYKSTDNLEKIKKKDKFVIYVGGRCEYRQHFISSFECVSIINKNFKKVDKKYLELANSPPTKEILFKENKSTKILGIMDVIDQLDHTKNRKKKWGSLMMGGCRIISLNDYKLITSKLK